MSFLRSSRFAAAQRAYHREADAAHFTWQTTGPYFAQTEAALLRDIVLCADEKLLELGAGEGGNLHHLRHHGALRVGIERSLPKARFGRRATTAQFVAGDAAALPIAGRSFDVVLIRDLLHHVPDRLAVLREARRVLSPAGRLYLIEPNARSPLALLQALTISAERGILISTASRLQEELVTAGFEVVAAHTEQALPLSRIVLHPRLGWTALGKHRAVTRTLSAIEDLAARVLPRPLWLYLCFHALPRN